MAKSTDRSSNRSLSELENKVMAVLWKRKQATADEVRLALEPEHELKDSTVRTMLRRLEEKGFAEHTTEGRTFVYAPTEASRNVAADMVRGLIDRFCDGSVEALLMGMVEREVVSPEKLQQLAKRVAKSRDSQANNSTPGSASNKKQASRRKGK